MVKEIKKRDDLRNSEITIFLNQEDDIIGIKFDFFTPIPLLDFNLDRILMPTRLRIPGIPTAMMPMIREMEIARK